MKRLLIIAFAIFSMQAIGQTGTPSEIQSVKVYRQSAEIVRDASVKLISGKQEVVLTGISTFINPASLQVQFDNKNCTLLSVKYEQNFILEKVNNPKIETLKDQLEMAEDAYVAIVDKRNSLEGMESILNKNQDLGGTSGFTPTQVMELTEVYQTKLLSIRKDLRKVVKEEKKAQQEKSKIARQLNEMNAKFNRPSGNIVLQIESKSATTVNIRSTYTVGNAGWYPTYDLRSDGITENVQLNYKANVYQNTGQDWENTNLAISTGNTMQDNNRPILRPLYTGILDYSYGYGNNYGKRNQKNQPVASNMAYEDDKAEEPVLDKRMGAGFKYKAVMGESQLNIEFTILDPQTILSDGKENLMALNTYQIETNYIYHSVPKISSGAFLIAKISDWGKYNLVPGEANIFFEGAFVGTTTIDPMVTSDTLLVSMGRDNSIIVERKPIEEFCDIKTIGSNKKQTKGYEISVKNKKSIPISIEILDQIPVSNNSEVEVTLDEKDGANYLEKVGKIQWTVDVQPGKTVKKKLIYTVKYPKKKNVFGTE